ncbi:molybdenum cofactor guanylyltransferase [Tessaracoccus sp. OH4464_COT-324]|uniref:molybdenum cofactor guanylyltransferase n=1 Tax=Tessaracoccus sp. OH4464_COT-324 TaxID=2491059 RepID=UPI0018F6F314|nr:NTP transferase domain-containing protein [Tessaracoccus sp. OH4464_COT-324]
MGSPSRVAIVLGGGRSRRMGRDKLELPLGESTLLGAVCAAAGEWADRVVVAGPQRPLAADFVQEQPPFGGPVAGLAAALAVVPADEYLLLAGDLARPREVVASLAAAAMDGDGVVLRDEEGWPQWLAGRYRGEPLRATIARLPEVRGVSVRRALGGLVVGQVPVSEGVVADIDTPEQFRRMSRN